MSVIVVGERANLPEDSRVSELFSKCNIKEIIDVGAFVEDCSSKKTLELLGVDHSVSANLLPPSPRKELPTFKKTDFDAARKTAVGLLLEARRNGIKLILCGRRVADAFLLDDAKIPSTHNIGGVEALLIPHPSRKNFFWNDKERTAKITLAVRRFLS